MLACLALVSVPAAEALALDAADKALYQRAFDAAEKGRWKEAVPAARQARDKVLESVVVWKHMQATSEYSFAQIAEFMKAHPGWPGAAALRRKAEEAMTGREAPEALIEWFTDNPPFSGRGKMFLADALFAVGEKDRAVEVVREAWVNEVFGRDDEHRFVARFDKFLTAELHAKRLDKMLWEGNPDSARRMLKRVDDGRRALAQARLALMTDSGNVDGLIANVPKALRDDPGLIYERVRWRRQHDLQESAADLLKSPAADTVRPRKWWTERAILTRHFLDKGLVTKAYETARNHKMKSGAGFAEAEWLAGWIALRFLGDAEVAYRHFTRMHEAVGSPISLGRAGYWAGRAAEAMGQKETANQWYDRAAQQVTTYYGQLAAARLDPNRRMVLPPSPRPTDADIAAFGNDPLVKVAKALAAIGRPEESRPFLWRVNEDAETPGVRALAAELALEFGRTEIAVALARRAAVKGTILIESGYPIPALGFVDEPERALVLSIIRQESNFNTDAVSSAGARGLMQLMPATAKLVAGQRKLAHADHKLTADGTYNVLLGSTYLNDLIKRFGGSYTMAVAGYNAGPGRPARWVKTYGDFRKNELDAVDWVEMIPFSETRNYVQRVLESLQIYRLRLGNSGLAMSIENDLRR